MLKRIGAVLIACGFAFSSVGCGGGGADDTTKKVVESSDFQKMTPAEKAREKEKMGKHLSPKERARLEKSDAAAGGAPAGN